MNVISLHSEAVHKNADVAIERSKPFGASKWLAAGLSVVMLVVVLLPIRENWKAKPKDNFPLSYFPMFSEVRGETYKVTHIVGLDAQANRHLVRRTFAGTGGFNQVRRQVRKTVRDGGSANLCQSVAARVAKSKQTALADLNQIRIVTGEYKLNEFFAGDRKPVREVIHATCGVERSRS